MTATKAPPVTLHVEVGRRTAWLYGERVLELLRQAHVERRMFDRQRAAWCIPIDRADDVLVIAENRQRRFVTVTEVNR